MAKEESGVHLAPELPLAVLAGIEARAAKQLVRKNCEIVFLGPPFQWVVFH